MRLNRICKDCNRKFVPQGKFCKCCDTCRDKIRSKYYRSEAVIIKRNKSNQFTRDIKEKLKRLRDLGVIE